VLSDEAPGVTKTCRHAWATGEVHDAPNKARYASARRRDREPAVSCEPAGFH